MRGPIAKPRSDARARACFAAGHLEQRGDAGVQSAAADALQSLGHQHAIVVIEAHDVGDGAERDQIQQRSPAAAASRVEAAARAQFGAQRQQHIEHDADPGQVLARESRSLAGSD